MNWIVEEKFTAQFDPANVYRITPGSRLKYMLLHIKVSTNGATNTMPLGEFETISEAVAKAEDHSKELTDNELYQTEEKTYTSEELLERD